MAPLVRAAALGKRFGHNVGVEGLSFEVEAGSVFGLVGPDGAGKSTTVRLLAGAFAPTTGKAWICDHDVTREPAAARALTGVVPQAFSLYGDLTVYENLRFFAAVYGVDDDAMRTRAPALLQLARLEEHRQRFAAALSGGMKRKLAVICALVHSPRVLLLDEPTAGVDPVSRRELWRMIAQLVEGGIAVVVSTAYMDEAERCHQLAFLHAGRIVASGAPDDLRARVTDRIVEIYATPLGPARASIVGLPAIGEVRTMGNRMHVWSGPGGPSLEALRAALTGEGVQVDAIREVSPTMEDVFIALRRAHGGAS